MFNVANSTISSFTANMRQKNILQLDMNNNKYEIFTMYKYVNKQL